MRAGKNCKLSTFLSCVLRLILKWVLRHPKNCINANTDASAAKSNLLFDLDIHIGRIGLRLDGLALALDLCSTKGWLGHWTFLLLFQ